MRKKHENNNKRQQQQYSFLLHLLLPFHRRHCVVLFTFPLLLILMCIFQQQIPGFSVAAANGMRANNNGGDVDGSSSMNSRAGDETMMGQQIGKKHYCPPGCTCSDETPITFDCLNLDLEEIPSTWPTHIERLLIRNWTVNTLEKQAFRRFQQLRELHIVGCPQLDLIDRHAFKQLRRLRNLVISGNRNLRELYKASFSGIGNENALSIRIVDNGLERLRAHTFKNAQNLRELIIEDRCYEMETSAFAGISRLDFLTLKGVCTLEPGTFQNTSRIHQLQIVDSSLSQLPKNVFVGLSHVNQLQIRECRIGRIEEGALAGLFTVGSVQLQSNQIARLSPGWAIGTENLGSLVFSYNTIREPLISPDCLRHNAQRFLFTENTLHCSCAFQWMVNTPEKEQWIAENYCGREEAFKALFYFSPAAAGCPPLMPLTTTTNVPSTTTINSIFLLTASTQNTARENEVGQSSVRSWKSSELIHQQQQQQRRYRPLAGNWINSEDEQFDYPAHQRRHSGKNGTLPIAVHRQIFIRMLIVIFTMFFLYNI